MLYPFPPTRGASSPRGPMRRQIANPVLGLPAARALMDLDPLARAALAEVLADLGTDAAARAQRSWAQNKGIMAAYWKAVSVYARHIRRVLVAVGREGRGGRVGREAGAASSHRGASPRLSTAGAVPVRAVGAPVTTGAPTRPETPSPLVGSGQVEGARGCARS
ncbi:hypothetical protein GGQ61_003595 [Phenylobacterium haematophilum]|jgi:hypothetical protein|uniref:Uncharacterized protein n=1 Tax=Phenylobacterium haematophilum TaxID=98513 RepID=A0A840A6M2_9CAUL|nr:hypothetical protein [Phenylobacterium haematophilum]MBB3892857.1 hypothetical protein [Phenylobacterium haematophilum]